MELKPLNAGLIQISRLFSALERPQLSAGTFATGDQVELGMPVLMRTILQQAAQMLSEQEVTLQTLAGPLRETAQKIMTAELPDSHTLSQGLTTLLQTRRTVVDKLTQLADRLQLAAELPSLLSDSGEIFQPNLAQFSQKANDLLAQINWKQLKQIDQTVILQIKLLVQNLEAELAQQPAQSETFRRVYEQIENDAPPDIKNATKQLNQPELTRLWTITEAVKLAKRLDKPDSVLPESAKPIQLLVERFVQRANALLSQINWEYPEQTDPKIVVQLKQLAQEIIPESELSNSQHTNLRRVVDQIAKSAPPFVQKASKQVELSELPRIWAVPETEQITKWLDTPVVILKSGASTVRELADSVNRTFQIDAENHGTSLLCAIQLPILNQQVQPQPVNLHVYHEKPHTKSDGSVQEAETWVRLTLEPEHIGPVEASFHLYGDSFLDIKISLADEAAREGLLGILPSIREACGKMPFTLGDLSIS